MDEDDAGSTLVTSGKPIKAITTSSKPDPARPDPTRPIRAGYLSRDHVEESYKALSEDTKKLFETLKKEFEGHQFDSVSDALGWDAYLSKTLKTPDLADLFTKWMFFNRPKAESHLGHIATIDLKDFMDKLTAANWRLQNEEYDRVFHLMWNTNTNYRAEFLLKKLNENFLTVEVDPRCLTPPEPLHDSFEAYDIVDTNLINILGLRYYTGHTTKDIIIAPFGRSLCSLAYLRIVRVTENTGRILFCSQLMKRPPHFQWTVSQYALVLEILRDGVAGDFYFVNNVTGVEDDTINSKPIPCGRGPFTVGKVKAPLGLELLGRHPRDFLVGLLRRYGMIKEDGPPNKFSPGEELDFELDILSTSKPEIVMTGIRESQTGKEIIGLYDKE